jgi:hypothetical protein
MSKKHHLPWNISNNKFLISLLAHRGKSITATAEGTTADGSGVVGTSTNRTASTGDVAAAADGAVVDFDPKEIPENPTPDKNAMPDIKYRKGLIRKLFIAKSLPGKVASAMRPPMSDEERERKLEEQKRMKFLRTKIPDMGRMGVNILKRLTRLRFMNVETEGGKRKVHQVRADMMAVDYPNANIYWMKLKVETLPTGVELTEIIKDETLNECLPLTAMPLKGENKQWGTLIKGYPGGLSGLPTVVTCKDAWDALPESAGPYTINFGLAEGGLWKKLDLTEGPHLLIAGASGQGKSNIENYILCSLLRKGLPRHMLNIVLFDLKDGMEFQSYESTPYFMENDTLHHVIYDMDDVLKAVNELEKVMHQREHFLKARNARSIREYNLSVTGDKKMPVVFVIFDEFATPVTQLKDAFMSPMVRLSNMSRVVGIHFIFATQYPKADIINTLISINFQMRVAFKMNGPASQSVLGTWGAERLSCKGRGILQHQGDDFEIQTPLIPNTIIDETVGFAVTGEKHRKASMVGEDDILTVALEKFDGYMEQERIYEYFKTRKVGHGKVSKLLQKMDGQIYVVNGNRYQVVRPPTGARRMVLMPDESNVPVNSQ